MKKGFTLAEVLITMSIVAVVALMTVPTIVKNYRYKTYAATLKQVVSQLEDAIKSSMADEKADTFMQSTGGVASSCTAGKETGSCYLFLKYIKYVLACSSSTDKRCVSESGYKSISGAYANNIFGGNCYKLMNGATVCMVYNDRGASSRTYVAIDINGSSQPNITGIDLFTGYITNNGSIADTKDDPVYCNTKSGSDNHVLDYTAGCLSKVIRNDWVIKE
jgi:prepilin-type N-terminal cleavage/methylation domain-containing protein